MRDISDFRSPPGGLTELKKTGTGSMQTGQDSEQGTLARSVGAEKGNKVSRKDTEVQPLESEMGAKPTTD